MSPSLPRFALLLLPASAALAASPLEIRLDSPPPAQTNTAASPSNFFGPATSFPGSHWESQAMPVGNGRLGAMIFGGPWNERIQFNESSLWTGGDNPSGGYELDSFGAYQTFGDLHLTIDPPSGQPSPAEFATPTCPSGHQPYVASEAITASTDGNPSTKWCVEPKGREVIWQVSLPAPREITGYSFVSANDVPERDPHTWSLEGSQNGSAWRKIDEKRATTPIPGRGQKADFPLASPASYRHYRFTFTPTPGVSHFQLAEISLHGIPLGSAPPAPPAPPAYSRRLDLRTGIHTTTWQDGATTYTREVFASHPDQAIVVRLTTEPPTPMRGKIHLAGGHGESSQIEAATARFASTLPNGLRKAALLHVTPTPQTTLQTQPDHLAWQGPELTLLLSAATDYALDPQRDFRSGLDPATTTAETAKQAAQHPFDTLRSRHIQDFQPFMDRLSLEVGPPAPGDLTARLAAYRAGNQDPHLEALMFQYGRYLLLSSSRGFLPANLQGLWNDSNKPAWYSDYHTNINLQMNYWGAEVANLPECASPLLEWTLAMIPGSREATRKAFGPDTPGWTMRTSVNIFGGNGWEWNLPASAWIALHFHEHYAFSGDKSFLAEKAWPVFREVSAFWLDHLVEREDGKLVVPQGWSPEHGPREDGVAHDQQIVWDLFTNTLEAATILGKSSDPLVRQITAAREKLLGPEIGSWGQLMEWTTERENLERSGHRHTSHLFAVFPGRQITLHGTPDLARAAATSLEARGTSGDSRRSWTWPWRTALWARLDRPDKAGEMIRGLLTHNTLPNLFTTHPPFQIDGNLGITGGMAEMLLQSHAGEISLLPAAPPQWPTGNATGLRARGGFTVDLSWQNRKLTAATLHSQLGGQARLRLPGNPPEITLQETKGPRQTTLKAQWDGAFLLPTQPDTAYKILPPQA